MTLHWSTGRRLARTNGWTSDRETVHPEEERRKISESTSLTLTHTKTAARSVNIQKPSLEVLLAGPMYHRNPNVANV